MKNKTKILISGIITLIPIIIMDITILISLPIFGIAYLLITSYFIYKLYSYYKQTNKEFHKLNYNNNNLNKRIHDLQSKLNIKLSLSQLNAKQASQLVSNKKLELKEINNKQIPDAKSKLRDILQIIKQENNKLEDMKAEVNDLDSDSEMSEYGLYNPHYEFENSWQYKDSLKKLRHWQRNAVRNKTAVTYENDWTINGSRTLGRRDTRYNIKAILRGFNDECTYAIKKVRYSNYKRIEKRIRKSFEQYNKIYSIKNISITYQYLDSKLKELKLAFEYKCKKEDEREELREERQKKHEQKELVKETKKKLKPIHKDITQYTNAINELKTKINSTNDNQGLINEISKLKEQIKDKTNKAHQLNHNVYNAQAGYVYIISNIGSFGKNIFKIGVTRRIDPNKRIQELSSASVPFKFDVHAFIFSTHAFDLETALHHHFHKQRVNLVNNHKEFFRISLADIKNELKKYKNVTVDFNEYPEADEYRQTVKVENEQKKYNKLESILND